jgi:hypothetical protein
MATPRQDPSMRKWNPPLRDDELQSAYKFRLNIVTMLTANVLREGANVILEEESSQEPTPDKSSNESSEDEPDLFAGREVKIQEQTVLTVSRPITERLGVRHAVVLHAYSSRGCQLRFKPGVVVMGTHCLLRAPPQSPTPWHTKGFGGPIRFGSGY